MAQLLATYTLEGERHRIELVRLRDGALVLDRPTEGAPRVVAELSREEGEDQARAAVDAGGYLERARAGEGGLCRALRQDEVRPGDRPLERAA
jgi:hypothetical protein